MVLLFFRYPVPWTLEDRKVKDGKLTNWHCLNQILTPMKLGFRIGEKGWLWLIERLWTMWNILNNAFVCWNYIYAVWNHIKSFSSFHPPSQGTLETSVVAFLRFAWAASRYSWRWWWLGLNHWGMTQDAMVSAMLLSFLPAAMPIYIQMSKMETMRLHGCRKRDIYFRFPQLQGKGSSMGQSENLKTLQNLESFVEDMALCCMKLGCQQVGLWSHQPNQMPLKATSIFGLTMTIIPSLRGVGVQHPS